MVTIHKKGILALLLLLGFSFSLPSPIHGQQSPDYKCGGSCGEGCSYSVYTADEDDDGETETVIATLEDGDLDKTVIQDASASETICKITEG